MFKAYLTAGIILAGLAPGSAATFAQQFPISAPHQQAKLNHDPDACGKALEKAADDARLRVQDSGNNNLPLVNAWLQMAQNAAENGDEQTCWYWYDRAQNMAR